MRKGVVVDLEGTIKSIEGARKGERMAGVHVQEVFVASRRSHPKHQQPRVVAVSAEEREVSRPTSGA